MHIEIEEKSPVSRQVKVSFEASAVDEAVDKRLRSIGKKTKIDGFRPGKAPASVLRRRFGQRARLEALDRLIDEAIREALQRDDLQGTIHIGPPDLLSGTGEGEAAEIVFDFERLPTIEVKDYKGVEIEVLEAAVSDDEVDAEILDAREGAAVFHAVEDRDTVETADVVVITYQGVGEGPVSGIRSENQQVDLGQPNLPQGFGEGVVGAKVGESFQFEITLPPDFGEASLAGATITLEGVVSSIQRREVPELDDSFVQEVSEFETVDAWKASLREELLSKRRTNLERDAKTRLLSKIAAENPAELPQGYVRRVARDQLMGMLGLQDPAELNKFGELIEQLLESQVESARSRIHESLVMVAIRDAEGLGVGDEDIDRWIEERAEQLGESSARLRARYSDEDSRQQLASELAYQRVIDWLWGEATQKVVDELPNPPHGTDGHVHGPDCNHDHDHDHE